MYYVREIKYWTTYRLQAGGALMPCASSSFSSCLHLIVERSNSLLTFHKWVSHIGSLHLWFLRKSWASYTAPRKVKLFPIERLISAQQPPLSVFARCFLTYLKYRYSKKSKSAAKSMPAIKRRNADRNCSRAKGSELLCSCFPGLQVPVIQYLRRKRNIRQWESLFLKYVRYLSFK